jgi:hypothetical protein
MQDYNTTNARLSSYLQNNNLSLKDFVSSSINKYRYKLNRNKISKWISGSLSSNLVTLIINCWIDGKSKDEYLSLANELGIETRTGCAEIISISNRKFNNAIVDSDIHITLRDYNCTLNFLNIPAPYRRSVEFDRSNNPNIYASLIWYITYFDRNIKPEAKLSLVSVYQDNRTKRREQSNILIPVSSNYLKADRFGLGLTRNFQYDELLQKSYNYSTIYFVDTENLRSASDILELINVPGLVVVFLNTWNKTCIAVEELLREHNSSNVMYYYCSHKGKQSMDTEIIFTVANADIDMLSATADFYVVSEDFDLEMKGLSDKRSIARLSCGDIKTFLNT